MISKIYMRRAAGKYNSYVFFEDENNKWYIISGTELATIKNKLELKLKDIKPNMNLIDEGPGRVFETDETKEIQVADIVEDKSEYVIRFNNGTTMQVTPIEVKTLLTFT